MRTLTTAAALAAVCFSTVAVAQAQDRSSAYNGTMTQSVATSQAGYSRPPPCQYQRPISMQLSGSNVVVSYKDWEGSLIHFRGTVDPAGAVLAWHTNGDGTKAALSGQFGPAGFTGHLQRDRWLCIYDVTMAPAPVPVR